MTQYETIAAPELDLDDIVGLLDKSTGKWRQTSIRNFLEALNVVVKVNGKTGEFTLNTDDLSDAGKQNRFVTPAEKEKLAALNSEGLTVTGSYDY